MAPKTWPPGSAPVDPVPSVLMFKPLNGERIQGRQIIKQGNAVLKLARLAYYGDAEARQFFEDCGCDEEEDEETMRWVLRLPEVLLVPVWYHHLDNKKFGHFDYENGPFVQFEWRPLWALFVEKGTHPLTSDPFEGRALRCQIECDGVPDSRPWVSGDGFHFKFTGVLGWQLLRRSLIKSVHFQCVKVI